MKVTVIVVFEFEPLIEGNLSILEASYIGVQIVRQSLEHLNRGEHGVLGLCGVEVRMSAPHLLKSSIE